MSDESGQDHVRELVIAIQEVQRSLVASMAAGSRLTLDVTSGGHSLREWLEALQVDIENVLDLGTEVADEPLEPPEEDESDLDLLSELGAARA